MNRISDPTCLPHLQEPQVKGWWLSILIGALLCILTAISCWALYKHDQAQLMRLVQAEARKLASYIQADMRARIPALHRLTRRWEIRGGTPRDEFFSDATGYVSDLPGFQALGWVDPGFHVRWLVPLMGNEQAQDLDLAFEKERLTALEKARNRRTPTMTPPLDLVQGGKGFLIYFPIYTQNGFGGFILAVFRINAWLDYVFNIKGNPGELESFKITVYCDHHPVYRQTGPDSPQGDRLTAQADTSVMEHDFTIIVRPTSTFIDRYSTILPELAALVGLVLAVMVSLTVHLFQRASTEAWRSHAVKTALESEIREHRQTEIELRQATSRLALATQAGRIGVWAWDIQSGHLTWNELMHQFYEVPPDAVPTYETWRKALHPEDAPDAEKLLHDAVQGEAVFDTEFRIVLSSGAQRHIKAAAMVERDPSGRALRVNGVNWDITERKMAEEKIRHLANHDALTGLPSLRLAKDRLLLALGLAHRNKALAAVMFVDLDGFKSVNDTYGHDAGDKVLMEVAGRLLSCVRATDTVARMGGDEFMLVATNLHSPDNAAGIAAKATRELARPFTLSQGEATIGASIGIALFPDHAEEADKLVGMADAAMYVVKNSGKNGYAFFDPDQEEATGNGPEKET